MIPNYKSVFVSATPRRIYGRVVLLHVAGLRLRDSLPDFLCLLFAVGKFKH